MNVKFVAIAAIGLKREIGLNGELPWNLPDEYDHYKNTVQGQYILIGRKNFEINRLNLSDVKPIVLTNQKDLILDDAQVIHTMDEVIAFAQDKNIKLIYVVGGAKIYDLTLPYLSEFLCSVVDYDGEADTYFPQYLSYDWEVLKTEIHSKWSLYHLAKKPDF